jgi:hypothetical protein
MKMEQVTPQTALLVLLGCLVVMTLFFMMVAAAALMVARISGHNFLGPILGMGLRMLSIGSDANAEDNEAKLVPTTPHRHIDAAQVKAQTEQTLDFERAVEKYREQSMQPPIDQGGGHPVEAQAIGVPVPPPSFTPPPSVVSGVPVTPIAPPIPAPPEGVPVTPITPPVVDVPEPLPVTPVAPPILEPLPFEAPPIGNQIPSEGEYTPHPPPPPTLPDEHLDDTPPPPPTLPTNG